MFQKQNKECLLKFIKLYVFNNTEFQALQLHTTYVPSNTKKNLSQNFSFLTNIQNIINKKSEKENILKSIHFKNTVARSSFHSKLRLG